MKGLPLALLLFFSLSFALTPAEEKQLLKNVAELKTAITIGFAIWDRRTIVRPFEDKIKGAMRKLAKSDEELASCLMERNLL